MQRLSVPRRPARAFFIADLRVHAAALAVALAAACPAASAAPQGEAQDPIGRVIAERGLLDAATGNVKASVRQMRDNASELVLSAMNFIGVPYRRGGNSAEQGFDCSGFTRHIFERTVGLVLPRRADEQAQSPALLTVGRHELRPGDLVFFNTLKRTFSHVGIYVGEGKFIHAPRPGGEVRVESMQDRYWAKRFTGARRTPAVAGPVDAAAVSSEASLAAH